MLVAMKELILLIREQKILLDAINLLLSQSMIIFICTSTRLDISVNPNSPSHIVTARANGSLLFRDARMLDNYLSVKYLISLDYSICFITLDNMCRI